MTDNTLALLITIQTERDHYNGAELRIKVSPVVYAPNERNSILGILDHDDNGHLANLQHSAHMSSRHADLGMVYGTPEYIDAYQVTLRRAEKMVKTLRTLERGMDRLDAKYGVATGFSANVLRMAAVLKIDRFVRQIPHNSNAHDAGQTRVMDAAAAQYHIDEAVREFTRKLKGDE